MPDRPPATAGTTTAPQHLRLTVRSPDCPRSLANPNGGCVAAHYKLGGLSTKRYTCSMTSTERTLHWISWIGLSVVGAFLLLGVAADLSADSRTGIPADHEATFAALTGRSFTEVAADSPGVASYLTNLEIGYALHELTFAVLFLTLVLIPLRRRRRWAWWACWAIMIANLGYTLTFGRHDPQIFRRSLAVDIVVPILLLATARQTLAAKAMDVAGPGAPTHVDGLSRGL